MPDEVITFLKEQGFMGLLVPRDYGGRDFSTLALSSVMSKVNACSSPMGTFVIDSQFPGCG
ncbi:MAG: acyl-CoA dehydrogenase family protein [Gammaproteobacteria bacterium]|nr:acyl-CoA dehydrogenase family protein [Gammaproteobacteria bacterium]